MSTEGVVNYQHESLPISLFSTHQIYMNRLITGKDNPPVGIRAHPVKVKIEDGRTASPPLSIDTNGMTLITHQLHQQLLQHPFTHVDYYDDDQIIFNYYKQCEELVKRVTGASQVYAFDHNVRQSNLTVVPPPAPPAAANNSSSSTSSSSSSSAPRLRGGNDVQGPAAVVHNDFTLSAALRRLRQLAQPPLANDVLRRILNNENNNNNNNNNNNSNTTTTTTTTTTTSTSSSSSDNRSEATLLSPSLVSSIEQTNRRYAFINVWRNISPHHAVEDYPLALCDATSFVPERDLITFEIRYVDRIGENYLAKYDPSHRWYFFPKLTRDEAILLKVWDSHGEVALKHGREAQERELQSLKHDNDKTEATSTTSAPSTEEKQVERDEQKKTDSPLATFSFHTAFKDLNARPDAPPRESIEVRLLVIY